MSHSKPEVVNMARLTTSVDLTQLLPTLDRFRTIDWALAIREIKYVPVLKRYLLPYQPDSMAAQA